MSLSFITVVFLLLARGFSPTGRLPLRRMSDDEDHYRGDDGDCPPSELLVAVAFGGRRRHILLSSLHWPLPSAFLMTLLLSDAAPSSLTSRLSFSSSLLLM
jgi:hypothetical protein